jgi:hypothetical protein
MIWNNLKKLDRQLPKTTRRRIIAALVGFLLTFGGGYIKPTVNGIGFGSPAAVAQIVRAESVADRYVRQETGKVDAENTLIARLVRYHQDIKKRPTRYRLDWKLTLGDYLGVNEPIKADRYPGHSTLKTNPIEGDRKAISSLNRRQREALVDALASAYKTAQQQAPEAPAQNNNPETNRNSKPTPQTPPAKQPASPSLSNPGDSQLLAP